MTLTFTCTNCDDAFDVDYAALADNPRNVRCAGCNKKLPGPDMEEFASTLDELLGLVATLKKKAGVSFEVDSEDLPAPHDGGDKDDDDEEESDDEDAAEEPDEDDDY